MPWVFALFAGGLLHGQVIINCLLKPDIPLIGNDSRGINIRWDYLPDFKFLLAQLDHILLPQCIHLLSYRRYLIRQGSDN